MNTKNKGIAIERLTALWALNECGLGGFMHAFNSPFTGIFVGGISILLISLISLYSNNIWKTLLKALSIVLIVKLSVSPHSPITAYVAVSFQAIFGAVIFSLFSVKQLPILIIGVVTFLESALQKLLVLTILYGQSLWDAIDSYGAWVSNKLKFLNLSLNSNTLILFYTSIYFLAGIIVGYFIIQTIKIIRATSHSKIEYIPNPISIDLKSKKNRILSRKKVIFWIITISLITIPLLLFNSTFSGVEKGLYLIARSLLILFLWYVILGPLLLKGLNKLLSKNKKQYNSDIQNTLELLPFLKDVVQKAWIDSKSYKRRKRVQYFLAKSIVYSIHFNIPKE